MALTYRLLILFLLALFTACSKQEAAQKQQEVGFTLASPESILSLTRESEKWRHKPLIRQALIREVESTIQATFQYHLWIFNGNGLKLLEAQYSSSELQVTPLTIQVSDTGLDVIEGYLLKDKRRIVLSLGFLHAFAEYYAELYQPKASSFDQQIVERIIVFNGALNFVLHHELNHYYLDDIQSLEKLADVFSNLFQLAIPSKAPDTYQLNEVRADYFAVLFTLLFYDCYIGSAANDVTRERMPDFSTIYPVRVMDKLANNNPKFQGGIAHIPWKQRALVLEGVLDFWGEKTTRNEVFQCGSYGTLDTIKYSVIQGKSAKQILDEVIKIDWGSMTDPTEAFLGFNRNSKISDVQAILGKPDYEENQPGDKSPVRYQEYYIPNSDSDINVEFTSGKLTRISLRTFSSPNTELSPVIKFLEEKGLDTSLAENVIGMEADQVEQRFSMLKRSDSKFSSSFSRHVKDEYGDSRLAVQILCKKKLDYVCSSITVGF